MSYAYLFAAVILVSIGQILQKIAAGQLTTASGPATLFLSFVRSVWFWLAMAAMAFGLLAWLLALTTIQVSKAYPVLALSFVLTTILSMVVLKERVSNVRWFGIGLITIGAAAMLAG